MSVKPKKKRTRKANIIVEETNQIPAILEQLKELIKNEVYVGVFSDDNELAQVAAIQEYGSVKKGIPERSFLRAGMVKGSAKISKIVRNGINGVVENGEDVQAFMSAIGEIAIDRVTTYFDKLQDPPLKPETIARKKDRNTKPLINTNQMREAIQFEVRPKSAKK
ncbi:hypothetical protein E0485_15165 [Paenibacillus albiflavus]|uniref:Uncharacterized protein n=1 Tax=Paenibacillus albiflavus TaxID=2545760 RepID=A0A4R4E8P5_9BACL|nr:hypothetical protein [Paenibacillus albiflavus]TCZ76174.1 hypothetical protein E0485_15165 [Paenibacillus albiflavus]